MFYEKALCQSDLCISLLDNQTIKRHENELADIPLGNFTALNLCVGQYSSQFIKCTEENDNTKKNECSTV